MNRHDLDRALALVQHVAATEVMPRFGNLSHAEISAKSGPLDLVTIADEAAEAQLAAGFEALFPGCAIVGEEAATRDPALIAQLATAPLAVVIDPIDGTYNFASALPLFGVIVAIVEHGITTAALIHDPVMNDTACALKGQGAWLHRPGRADTPLRVAPPVPVPEMAGSVSWRFMPEPRRSQVCARLPMLAAAWDYRCAAHQYRLLAAGRCHYAVYNKLLPWDHAAGVLLHQEAGGHAARLDGSPYTPAQTDGGLICTPDPQSWTALHTALFA